MSNHSDPRSNVLVAPQSLVEIDRLCDQFERQCRRGEGPRIEHFLEKCDHFPRDLLLRELLAVELEFVRADRGQPDAESYYARFPDDTRVVLLALAEDAAAAAAGESSQLASPNGHLLPATAVDVDGPIPAAPGYEILEEIGRGGMGVVFRARQLALGRIVALKMILAGRLASAAAVRRFQTEAAAIAGLDHPGIVPIFEVGEHQGRHYYSMGHVDGSSLAERLSSGPLTPRDAATLVIAIADAVHYAHERGVIHRDLKPANILLDACGRPRVTDFGLAKQLTNDRMVTITGEILGSPSYMPPEQAAGRPDKAGVAADVYSLGAMLYALLVGRPPFQAASAIETLKQVIEQEPTPPRQLNPAIPRDLDTIVLKCLEKASSRRYPTVRELSQELQRWLDGKPITARPISRLERSRRWVVRNPMLAAVGSTTLFLMAAVALVSTVAYLRETSLHDDLERQRSAATTALERETTANQAVQEELLRSLTVQAHALRSNGQPGRRLKALAAIASAVKIRPTRELRDEAIAALRLVDVEFDRTLPGAPDNAYWVDFDPQFHHYVLCDHNRHASIRRVDDGQEVATLTLPTANLRWLQLKFSPDGRFLTVVFNDGDQFRGFVFDVERPQADLPPLFQWKGRSFGFTRDGKRILTEGTNPGECVWRELPTGKELSRFAISPGALSVDVSPDGRWVSAQRGSQIEIASAVDGKSWRQFAIAEGVNTKPTAWAPDGRFVAMGADNCNIYVWDIELGQLHSELVGHFHIGIDVAFWPNGELLVSRSWDGTTRFWNYKQGRQVLALEGHFYRIDDSLQRMAIFDGNTAGFELWRLATSGACRTLHHPTVGNRTLRPGSGVRSARFSPDGRWLAAGAGEGVRIWDAAGGVEQLRLPTGDCSSILFHPADGSLITYSRSGVQRWQIELEATPPPSAAEPAPTYRLRFPQLIHPDATHPDRNQMALDAAGRRLAVRDGTRDRVLTFDLQESTSPKPLGNHPRVAYVDISPDGNLVATGQWGAGAVKVWNSTSGTLCTQFPIGSSHGQFSADGKWLLTAEYGDRMQRTWRVGDWTPGPTTEFRRTFMHHPVSFTADGALMVMADLGGGRLFDAKTRGELATLPTEDDKEIRVTCTLSPRGDRLAIFGGYSIDLWDLSTLRATLHSLGLDWHATELPMAEGTAAPARLALADDLAEFYRDPLDARLDRARSLACAGKWREAAAEYKQLTPFGRQVPDDARYYEQAILLALLDDKTALREHCHEISAGDHQSFWIGRCGCMLDGVLDDQAAALQIAQLSWLAHPDNPFYLVTIGAIKVRSGDFTSAQESVRAFLSSPSVAGHHFYGWPWMALACHGAGQTDEARVWLRKVDGWLAEIEKNSPPPVAADMLRDEFRLRLEVQALCREAHRRLDSQ